MRSPFQKNKSKLSRSNEELFRFAIFDCSDHSDVLVEMQGAVGSFNDHYFESRYYPDSLQLFRVLGLGNSVFSSPRFLFFDPPQALFKFASPELCQETIIGFGEDKDWGTVLNTHMGFTDNGKGWDVTFRRNETGFSQAVVHSPNEQGVQTLYGQMNTTLLWLGIISPYIRDWDAELMAAQTTTH